MTNLAHYVFYSVTGLGGCVLFIGYGQVTFWLMTSHRQTFKIRESLLRAVLRQEIGWFDTNATGQINGRLSEYVICTSPSIVVV